MFFLRSSRSLQVTIALGVVSLIGAGAIAPVRAAKPDAAKSGDSRAKSDEAPPPDRGVQTSPQKKDGGRFEHSSAPVRLEAKTPLETAARVDELVSAVLQKAGTTPASRTSDEDFLRRVSLDIAGTSPSPREVTLFGLDSDSHKREKAIDRLLNSTEYSRNWARYWRDTIFMRATEVRSAITKEAFESWMSEQLAANKKWSEITTDLLTATGDVRENGQTALIFAHDGAPQEIAAEASRIFLGIQIQCANCHDHPTDSWKRAQFHELAAFFPRVRIKRTRVDNMQKFEVASFEAPRAPAGRAKTGMDFQELLENPEKLMALVDQNRDGKMTKEEASRGPNRGRFFERLSERADADKDGAITLAELKQLPINANRVGRGSAEYYMPDLQNPQSKGTEVDPVFFVGAQKVTIGLGDLERRKELSRFMTSTENPWFAKAFVNRIWGEMLGEGFYMPVDDIGPERGANYPEAIDALAHGFASSGYDIKWLFRAIANTRTYQRNIRARDPKQDAPLFAAAVPTRLRADQLYDSLTRVLGIAPDSSTRDGRRSGGFGRYLDGSPRGQFNQLFAFDPSTAPDEINGTVPQSLFMMNSPIVNGLLKSAGKTRLHKILEDFPNDKDALSEMYLLVHAREPSAKELLVCQEFIKQVQNRQEAFEDILWSLLNSTEFQTKR